MQIRGSEPGCLVILNIQILKTQLSVLHAKSLGILVKRILHRMYWEYSSLKTHSLYGCIAWEAIICHNGDKGRFLPIRGYAGVEFALNLHPL